MICQSDLILTVKPLPRQKQTAETFSDTPLPALGYTWAKTEIVCPKNVGALVAMNFT